MEQDIAAIKVALLEPFVLRARRIRAHSLAADVEALHAFATGRMTIDDNPDEGKTYVVQAMPPEEQLESAAARVRPLILRSETTYLDKALKAIAYLVRDDKELAGHTAAIYSDWKKVVNSDSAAASYLRLLDKRGVESATLSDVALAHAYIYGDVVHHDEKRLADTEAFGVRARYQAAALIVPRLMLQALATLDVVECARRRGIISMPDELFEREVVVTQTTLRREAVVHVAEVGTKPPSSLSEPFGPDWQRLRPEHRNAPSSDEVSEDS